AYEIYPPEIAKPIDDDDRRVLETGEPIADRLETTYNHKGEKMWLLTSKVPLRNQNKEIYALVGVTRNITERKKTRDEIKLAKERYELVLKATKDAIYDWNIVVNNLYWSDSLKLFLGRNFDRQNFPVEHWEELIHPHDRQNVCADPRQALDNPSEAEWQAEYRFAKADGSYNTVLERGFIIRDKDGTAIRMIGALQDVTDLRRKDQKIHASLKEKEILLAEIHHRVKNNLAIISGMLQLQAFEEEEQIRDKLLNSVRRIQSIALIHEHLYRSESFSKLNFSVSLKELACNIINTFKSGKGIKLNCELDPVKFYSLS